MALDPDPALFFSEVPIKIANNFRSGSGRLKTCGCGYGTLLLNLFDTETVLKIKKLQEILLPILPRKYTLKCPQEQEASHGFFLSVECTFYLHLQLNINIIAINFHIHKF